MIYPGPTSTNTTKVATITWKYEELSPPNMSACTFFFLFLKLVKLKILLCVTNKQEKNSSDKTFQKLSHELQWLQCQ